MIRTLFHDARELARTASGAVNARTVARAVLSCDSFAVTSLFRARSLAHRLRIPGISFALRLIQTAVYGIELDKEITLGHGVYFVHTLGTVVGGDSVVGDRVRFMGNNTVGTAKDNGYPVIEDEVVVGCGARVLGPIRVGARSVIGANAVVLSDVPPDSVVVGVPGQARPRRPGSDEPGDLRVA